MDCILQESIRTQSKYIRRCIIYPLNQDLSCKPDKKLLKQTGYEYFKAISILADGAAIGPEMDALYKMSVEKRQYKVISAGII